MTTPNTLQVQILRDLPDPMIERVYHTYPTAYELIKTAAYNRRMRVGEYVGRAALAFAIHDSEGEHTWEEISEKEPPMADRRRRKLPPRRLRGRGFGKWKIGGLS